MKIKKNSLNHHIISCITFLLFLVNISNLTSCSSGNYQVTIKPSQTATKFPPIKNYKAELDCITSKRTFYNDEDIKLTFRLTNFHTDKLIIYEWMRKEDDNILIRFTNFSEEESLSPLSDWNLLQPKLDSLPKRQPLELAHQNSVLVDKILKASELGITTTILSKPQKIAIIAELNLTSLKIRTPAIVIEIRERIKVYSE